jgi:hypothetical protein
MVARRIPMPNAYGFWKVTTEGDCEGRTTSQLGTYEGYLDDIAFALANRAMYGLRFTPLNPSELRNQHAKATKVEISLDIETGTWDMKGKERVEYFRQMLMGRDVYVKEGQYFACVELVKGIDPEAQEAARQELLRQTARSKLTEEELKALLGK